MKNNLVDLCAMQAGVTVGRHDFKPYGKTQIVQLKDIDADGNLRSPLEHVDLKREIKRDSFLCDDDILLKARGGQIAAAHIKQAPANAIASSGYFILRADAAVSPAFLAWFLNNTRLPVLQSSFMQLITLKDLKQMPVSLPSLAVQEKIANAHALAEEARVLFSQYHRQVNRRLKAIATQAAQKERHTAV